MLDQRRGRWASISPVLGQRLVFARYRIQESTVTTPSYVTNYNDNNHNAHIIILTTRVTCPTHSEMLNSRICPFRNIFSNKASRILPIRSVEADTAGENNVGLMLVLRRRKWYNIEPV